VATNATILTDILQRLHLEFLAKISTIRRTLTRVRYRVLRSNQARLVE
jgi:hypothetical protein